MASADAEALFRERQQQIDELLGLPFVPKLEAAEKKVAFTIYRIVERNAVDPETGEVRDEWQLLVHVQDAVSLTKKNTRETVALASEQPAIVALDRNPINDARVQGAQEALDRFGPVPNAALRLIKNKNPLHSPIAVLCHVDDWKPLADK